MLTDAQRRFLGAQRVARFASAAADGTPHVVPVCFVCDAGSAYFSIDEKPKRRTGRALKRMRNIEANPKVSLVVDRYEEDWTRLGWVMLHGHGDILDHGNEHARVQALLRDRYPQLRSMHIETQPVVAIRIHRVTSWGNLEVP